MLTPEHNSGNRLGILSGLLSLGSQLAEDAEISLQTMYYHTFIKKYGVGSSLLVSQQKKAIEHQNLEKLAPDQNTALCLKISYQNQDKSLPALIDFSENPSCNN